MAAGTYNFTIEQGATFTRLLTLKENASVMNLAGYSAASQMRSTHDSSTVVGTISANITNASAGQLTLSMTASATGGIEEGIYVYDVEITASSGAVNRILQGRVTLTPQVTR
jgi:hypothetical protein|tara:strand:- start:1040 stop:1375 length:336 start_codon:yes stop_codon:yes gene_type:complete